jgi:hypothetical protein
LLVSLDSFRVSSPLANQDRLERVLADLKTVGQHIPVGDTTVIEAMYHLVSAFLSLCHWIHDTMTGVSDSDRHLSAARAHALATIEVLSSTEFPVFRRAALEAAGSIEQVTTLEDVGTVVQRLQGVSVPVFLTSGGISGRHRLQNNVGEGETDKPDLGPYVIKVMFTIDGKAWPTLQIINTKTIYDLRARVTIPRWPEAANHLVLDYVSTLDTDLYKVTPLQIDRPQSDSMREFELAGHIEFPVGQSILSDPVTIRVRGTFHSSTNNELRIPATIVGYDQLRVRVTDRDHVPLLSRYRSIDARILEVIDEVRKSLPHINPDHLTDFINALSAVANFLGISLQEARYREGRTIREKDFQEDLIRHMRQALGEDVSEAPKQGGGPTDIQYRSVTVELKVEKRISERRDLVKRYLAQPTQYTSGGGGQLGILCILDLTEKHNPPANPQNNITLETPQLHGFVESEPGYPTKVAVVIIDGNLRLPSSYS